MGTHGQLSPKGVVLHIGEGFQGGFHALFSKTPPNPDDAVSAHYVVYKDGSIEQWVDERDAAYHAGQVRSPDPVLALEGRNPNRLFIGIEHEGFTGEPWTEQMIQADLWLLRGIGERYGLVFNENNLLGHYRIDSITRKRCPGTGCPFSVLLDALAAFSL